MFLKSSFEGGLLTHVIRLRHLGLKYGVGCTLKELHLLSLFHFTLFLKYATYLCLNNIYSVFFNTNVLNVYVTF